MTRNAVARQKQKNARATHRVLRANMMSSFAKIIPFIVAMMAGTRYRRLLAP